MSIRFRKGFPFVFKEVFSYKSSQLKTALCLYIHIPLFKRACGLDHKITRCFHVMLYLCSGGVCPVCGCHLSIQFFETLTRRVFHDRVYFLFMLIKWDKLHHNYVHVGVHLSLLLRNNGTKSYTSHCFVIVEQYIYISIRLLC